jgi:FixJ family two-component response regulator
VSSIQREKREPDNDERNKQIAYELSLSEATVKAHVSAIFQ